MYTIAYKTFLYCCRGVEQSITIHVNLWYCILTGTIINIWYYWWCSVDDDTSRVSLSMKTSIINSYYSNIHLWWMGQGNIVIIAKVVQTNAFEVLNFCISFCASWKLKYFRRLTNTKLWIQELFCFRNALCALNFISFPVFWHVCMWQWFRW
jgi:hypothetical protein